MASSPCILSHSHIPNSLSVTQHLAKSKAVTPDFQYERQGCSRSKQMRTSKECGLHVTQIRVTAYLCFTIRNTYRVHQGENRVGEKATLLAKKQTQSCKVLFLFSIISAGEHSTMFVLSHNSEYHFCPQGPNWRHPSSHQPLQPKLGVTNTESIHQCFSWMLLWCRHLALSGTG